MSARAVFILNCFTSRKFILFAIMIAVALLNSGCMGMLYRHLEKGDIGNYSDLKRSMPPPQEGMGRLVVYITDGGPDVFLTTGIIDGCTIDNRGYKIMGRTYWYVDLQAGSHRVTATDVMSMWTGMPVRYGEKILDIDLQAGETYFVKMIMSGTTLVSRLNSYAPTLVSSEVAESELKNLDFYKNYKTNTVIGESQISAESPQPIITAKPSSQSTQIPQKIISESPQNESKIPINISNKIPVMSRNTLAILPINASKMVPGQGIQPYTATKVAVIDKLKKLSSDNQEFEYIYNYYAFGADSSDSKLSPEMLSEDTLNTLWIRKSIFSDNKDLNTDLAIEIGKKLSADLVFTCNLFGEAIIVILIDVATKEVYHKTYYYQIFSGYSAAPKSLDDFINKYKFNLLK
jgi:hypothetical protein